MSGSLANLVAETVTPRGMVSLAYGSFTRLWLAQLLAAVCAAFTALWFFQHRCVPVIDTALAHLTGTGEIHFGKLAWHGVTPKVLTAERVLALDIDLDHTGQIHPSSDVQVEFGRDSIRILSLPGYADIHYPDDLLNQPIPVSRATLGSFWNGWLPEMEVALFPLILLTLLLVWSLLATVYCLPVRTLAFLAGRDLGLLASWRLAGAALLPGGFALTLALPLYDFGVLDLVGFIIFVVCAHLQLGWIYLVISQLFLPGRLARPVRKYSLEAKTQSTSDLLAQRGN